MRRQAIGLPPPMLKSTYPDVAEYYNNYIYDSMIILNITPKKPSVRKSIEFFRLQNAMSDYIKELRSVLEQIGIDHIHPHFFTQDVSSPSSGGFLVAVLADNSPSETFSASYDQSFLARFTSMASSGISQMIQMTGARNIQQFGEEINRVIKNKTQPLQNSTLASLGAILQAAGGGIESLSKKAQQLLSTFRIASLAAGYQLNFPKVWTGAGYSPSYSFTVRLYNPTVNDKDNPKAREIFYKYVIQPLAMLLLLVVPRSDWDMKNPSRLAYNWPFFCSVKAKGLFQIKYGALTDVSVVKGGDNNAIAYTQRPGIIDIRLSFVDLYDVMIANGDRQLTCNLQDYLEVLTEQKDLYDPGEGDIWVSENEVAVSKNAVRLADRNPTLRATNVQLAASQTLLDQQLSDSINNLSKKHDVKVSSLLAKQILDTNSNDPIVIALKEDYIQAQSIDPNNIIDQIQQVPDNTNVQLAYLSPSSSSTSSSPTAARNAAFASPSSIPSAVADLLNTKATSNTNTTLAASIVNNIKQNKIITPQNPVAAILESNPTRSSLYNEVLAKKAGSVKIAKNIRQAKNTAIAKVRSIDKQQLKVAAKRHMTPHLVAKLSPTLKEDNPGITDQKINSFCEDLSDVLLS